MRKKGRIYTALTLALALLFSTLIAMGHGNSEVTGESVVAPESNVESLEENDALVEGSNTSSEDDVVVGDNENPGDEYGLVPENLEEGGEISGEYNTSGSSDLEFLGELDGGGFLEIMPLQEIVSYDDDDDDDDDEEYTYHFGVRVRASGITMPNQVTNGMGADLGIVFIIRRDGTEVWRRPMVWQNVGEGGTFVFSPQRPSENDDEVWELDSAVPPSAAGAFTWSIEVGTNTYQLTGPTSGTINFTHLRDSTCPETGHVWHQYFWDHTFQFTRSTGTGDNTNTGNTGGNTAAPQTGDTTSVMLYILLALASLSVLLGVPYHKRNRYSPSLLQEISRLK